MFYKFTVGEHLCHKMCFLDVQYKVRTYVAVLTCCKTCIFDNPVLRKVILWTFIFIVIHIIKL